MRQLTAFASYFDNLGALLIGRARFYNMDGSPAEVFSINSQGQYATLGNIVFTNSSGQLTPQVFLGDHDYLVIFDKYVGGGTMSEDVEEESWEEQGSAIDQYNTLGVVLEGGATRSVNTIADLRETAPIGDNEVVLLLGYNSVGDVEPIYYRWNKNSTIQDNNGSFIKVNDIAQGRWYFVDCPEYLDVRHFGAFPMETIEENAVQRARIQLASIYAEGMGRGLYFPATYTANYFDVSGLTLIGVDSHPNARVFSKNLSGGNLSGIKNIYCVSAEDYFGEITLSGSTVKTSWGANSQSVRFSPTAKLVMDSEILASGKTWTGIAVEIETYTSGCTFDGCEIVSAGKIDSAVTIQNCELKTSWFSDDYNWSNLTSYSNTIFLKNCKDAMTYVTLKNKQNENDYGDLDEGTISNVTLLAGCIAENAAFTNVTLAGNSELHNVSGNVLLTGVTSDHNWIDCWITITSTTTPIGSLQFRRGELKSSSALTILNSSNLTDVYVDSEFTCFDDLKLDRCSIVKPVTGIRLDAVRNDIFSTLSVRTEDNKIFAKVACNRFFDSGYLAVLSNGYTGEIDLDISLTGNYSDHDFWDDSAFDGVTHSTTGKIVYEGNYGGCPGNYGKSFESIPYSVHSPDQTWGADITEPALNQPDNSMWLVQDSRSIHSVDCRQFWWSIKLNKAIDSDDYGIWRCKRLRFYRTMECSVSFIGRIKRENQEECITSIPLQDGYLTALNHGTTLAFTRTFQSVSDASELVNNLGFPSRLLQIITQDGNQYYGQMKVEVRVS